MTTAAIDVGITSGSSSRHKATNVQSLLMLRESGGTSRVCIPDFQQWRGGGDVNCVREEFGGEETCDGGSGSSSININS
jgi:hypothetical protein